MRKKILFGVMYTALAVMLIGCGDNKSKDNNISTTETTQSSTSVTDNDSSDTSGSQEVTSEQSDSTNAPVETKDMTNMTYDEAKAYLDTLPETDSSYFETYTINSEGEAMPDGECAITYNGPDTVVVVPEEIDGLKVTEIYGYGFANNDNLIAVKLPLTVKNIEAYAFCNDSNLKFVTGLDNVEKLGYAAFVTSSDLYVVFTDSVKDIYDDQIFSRSVHLKVKKDSFLANVDGHLWYFPGKNDVEYYE